MRGHTHPATIVANLWRVLFLIIVPVLRGFLLALQGDLAAWVRGAWIDIVILLIMVGVAIWSWRAAVYWYDGAGIQHRYGLFFRRQRMIAWSRVTTISVTAPFYLRPIHGARLRVDTLGGSRRREEISILLYDKAAERVLAQCKDAFGGPGPLVRRYEPRMQSVLALAILSTNSFAGIIFIATFISQSGKLLGAEFSDLIIETFEEAARTLSLGIPPAAAAIAYILIAGWLIGFAITFIRYKDFTVSYRARDLSITSGIFTKREYLVEYDSISFADIRQSIITKVLRLYSLYIAAVGYNKQKDDISCIIPAETERNFLSHRGMLFPRFQPTGRMVVPHWKGLVRFVGDPLYFCIGIPVAMGLFYYFAPGWSRFILFVGLMSMFPAVMFLVVRLVDYATGGLSWDEINYTLRYSKGLSLHTVIIPRDKVIAVKLRQGFFQKFGRYCDLLVYARTEGRQVLRCRSLEKEKLAQIFNIT